MDGNSWSTRQFGCFFLSDHADRLIEVIKDTGAELIKVTHGQGDALSRFLTEKGINTSVLNEFGFKRETLE